MRSIGFAWVCVVAALVGGGCGDGSSAPQVPGGSAGSSTAAYGGAAAAGGKGSAIADSGAAGRAIAGADTSDATAGVAGTITVGASGAAGTSSMQGGAGGYGGVAGHADPAGHGGVGGRGGAAGNGGVGGRGGAAGNAASAGSNSGLPPELWLAVWGGSNVELSGGFAISPNHVVIAAGTFNSPSIDLDPTSGVDLHQHLRPVGTGSLDNHDAFVVWLNADGSYRNGCTIGGNPGSVGMLTVAAGANDSAIVAASFSGTIDFDPGPGERAIAAGRTGATFVLSLTSSCELSWVHPLHDAILQDYLISTRNRPLATDADGNIYLIGVFTQFDFDLGPGTELRSAVPQGIANSFLLKLNPNAGFVWVRTLERGTPSTVAVSPDGKTIVVGGAYGGNIDLDPSSAENLHTAHGVTDAYAVALSSDGDFLWGYSHGRDLTSRFSDDLVAISASGSALLGAPNNSYLEHRAANGASLWAWDPAYKVRSAAFALDGRLVLLGRLSGPPNPTDPLNPTPPSEGSEFLSVFETNGTFVSSLAFGGSSVDTTATQVFLDGSYAYVSGTISESPVSNFSSLPEGSSQVSIRPRGTDDIFLFRTKLPH